MFSITGLSPQEGSLNNDLDTLIEFTIVDDGSGINISTLTVTINGSTALQGVEFQPGFSGEFSEITPDGDNYLIAIDSESDFDIDDIVHIKIQVRNISGSYSNIEYAFRIIQNKPTLITTSPLNDSIVTQPQMLYLQVSDLIDGINTDSINVTLNNDDVVIGGVFQDGYDDDISSILYEEGVASITIHPTDHLVDGDYLLSYSIADTSGNAIDGKISFSVILSTEILPAVFPQTGFIGFYQGITKASDMGVGDTVMVEWSTPSSRYYNSDVYALIYSGESRLSLFNDLPSYIATSSVSSAYITGLTTGLTKSFGVRALETYRDALDVSGMTEISDGTYIIPQPVLLSQQIASDDAIIYASSISGYPASGYLLIGNEVIRYSSISEATSSFLVPPSGRGLNNTTASTHLSGDEAKLFLKCQDANNVIIMCTPTYHEDNPSGRELNNVGLVITDSTLDDRRSFPGLDHCGYHQSLPEQIFRGQNDCGSYLGGEYNGFRGMHLFGRMADREEELLNQTGEHVIILKRKWQGEVCGCMTIRGVHPKKRTCNVCYGTGYIDGYDQYMNTRRQDGLSMVKFNEATDDLNLGSHQALNQNFEPQCWTLPMPQFRDRDIIIRLDYLAQNIEFIYEILNSSRERVFFSNYGRQKLSLKRLDKTSVIYQFPFEVPEKVGL